MNNKGYHSYLEPCGVLPWVHFLQSHRPKNAPPERFLYGLFEPGCAEIMNTKEKRVAFATRFLLAPPTGLEPVTSWLTVMRSTDWAMEEYKCWHLPIFTGRHQPTIVGTTGLNFCVRYGNRWTPGVIDTNLLTFLMRFIPNQNYPLKNYLAWNVTYDTRVSSSPIAT